MASSRLWSDARVTSLIRYRPTLETSGVCSHRWCLVLSLSSSSPCHRPPIVKFSRFSLVNLWNISTKEFPVFFFQEQRGSLIWAPLVLVVSAWNLDLNWFEQRKTGAFKHFTQMTYTVRSHLLIWVYRVQMSSFTKQGSGSVSTGLEQEMGSAIPRAGLLIYHPWPDAS